MHTPNFKGEIQQHHDPQHYFPHKYVYLDCFRSYVNDLAYVFQAPFRRVYVLIQVLGKTV